MSTKRTTAESPEQLVESLRALIAEAEKTLGAELSEGAEAKLGDLRECIAEAKHRIEHGYSVARDKVVAGAKQTDSVIRAHPYESLAIALGVGVLLGAVLRRSN